MSCIAERTAVSCILLNGRSSLFISFLHHHHPEENEKIGRVLRFCAVVVSSGWSEIVSSRVTDFIASCLSSIPHQQTKKTLLPIAARLVCNELLATVGRPLVVCVCVRESGVNVCCCWLKKKNVAHNAIC